MTLTIDRTSIAIGGTARLTAVVSEASFTAPHNGTMVTFTGGLGTFNPIEAPTVGGIARTTYTGTTSGTSKLGAFSGPAKATEIEVLVGSAAAERVTVRTEPATLPAQGGTVTVIANVQDKGGSGLPHAAVNFTVDNGTLSANTAFTDANGEARVTLTTTRTTKVDANVSGKSATQFTLTALAAPTVTVGSCSATPFVGVAVSCTITPTVTTGGAPITNVVVNWGDGTPEVSLGPITGATVSSHVYSRADTYTVVATATDANGQFGRGSAAVTVNRSLPTVTITCPTTATVGVGGSFTVTPPSSPPIQISNITVDFGDGTSRNLGAPTGATSFTKAYGAEGGYTAVATITDIVGQRGSASCSVVVGRATSPVVTFTQSSDVSTPATTAVPESFTVSATTATGVTLRSIVVTRQNGEVLYNATGSGSFAARVTAGDILTATATDSAGNTGIAQLVVR
jgi:hypothetical protein